MLRMEDLSNVLGGHGSREGSGGYGRRDDGQARGGDGTGGAPAGTGAARLVQQFLNTYNHEFPHDADRLGTCQKAARWLGSHGLMLPSQRISESNRRRLVRAREALRSLVRAGRAAPVDAEDLRVLNAVGRTCLSIRFEADGTPRLEPTSGTSDAALGKILAAGYTAWASGTLPRLKTCARCEWVFYDLSKNRSGAWCSMSICGNRTKNRAYRRRRAGGP